MGRTTGVPKLISNSKPANQDRKWLLWWALLFATSSILLTGYRVYFHNQALQIPLVRLLNDPSLYPNDPFAATLPYYASSLWRIVAWCARIIPLEPLLLILFLIERFIVIYAAGNLAFAFAPRSRLAAAGAMAFLATDPTPIIGGGTLLMPYFEQTSLAMGFFMLGMAAFHRGKPIAWAIWLAVGFNCNSMYGCYALAYFGAVLLLVPDYRRDWRQWLTSLGLFALLSLPAIILSAGTVGKGTISTDLWLAACRARVPHHIFPSTWPSIKFARFAILALLVTDAAVLSRREEHPASVQRRSGYSKLSTSILIWTAVSIGWVIFAVAAERLKSPIALMLQSARATDLWYACGVTALMAIYASGEQRSLRVGPVFRESRSRNLLLGSVLALIPFALFNTAGRFALIPLAGLCAFPLLNRVDQRKLTAMVAVIIFVFSARAFVIRCQAIGLNAACVRTPCKSMRLACDWARTHTPKDAVFLVNPNCGEFRALSERPAFVTWKDGSALLWNRPFAAPWSERIHALGYDVTAGELPGERVNGRLDTLYSSLTDSDALRLSNRYDIGYWIVSADHKSRLPVVYCNRYLKVLKTR